MCKENITTLLAILVFSSFILYNFTQTKLEEANRSLVYGSTLDINGQTQDRKRIQGLDRNPNLPSPSNIKQKSQLKRNNGIQRQYLNFRESFLTKIYIWHLSDVRFKRTHK